MATFHKGDEVFVFYRVSSRCVPQRKYLAVLDPRHGACRPRMGMSDGWLAARVLEDYNPSDSPTKEVRIAYRWPHFFTARGLLADRDDGWAEWFPATDVRSCGPPAAVPPPWGRMLPSDLVPDLAIITFRWGGANEITHVGQWGETGTSVSDTFINAFLDRAVEPTLKQGFEVWTVYIEDHSDMVKIGDTAHLIFGPSHPARRAKRTCAMYHLYPTAFEENCVPTGETGNDGGAALVDQKSLFYMIKAVERVGIPTRYPHCSQFYEVLTSKRWTAMMSIAPHLRVPPTVALPRMLIEEDIPTAATRGIAALSRVKQQQAQLRGETMSSEQAAVTVGVAKLGFSWEALDVKFWERQDGLEEALTNLTQAIEISNEWTGQPHDCDSVMLQEYVKHDMEMRLYVVEGKVEAIIYTKFCKVKENKEFGEFQELFTHEQAADQWMDGDSEALADGERQCREVTAHWMDWVLAQVCEVPPAIRFDYFVGRADEVGKAAVWTLEICELGFSMLGDEELPTKVFAAMARSCLGTQAKAVVVPAAAKESESKESAPAEAAPAQKEDAPQQPGPGKPPAVLYVTVPHASFGTVDQQECTGMYKLAANMTPNGHPLWTHTRGDRYLFQGSDHHWYVGDEEEREANFECAQGYIRHAAMGHLPHAVVGPWERGPDWVPDYDVVVSLEKNAPPPKATMKGKGLAGKGKRK